MRGLIARVKAQFRMMQLIRGESIYEESPNSGEKIESCGNLTILLHRRDIQTNGNTLVMKPKEYDLLKYTTENLSRVITWFESSRCAALGIDSTDEDRFSSATIVMPRHHNSR